MQNDLVFDALNSIVYNAIKYIMRELTRPKVKGDIKNQLEILRNAYFLNIPGEAKQNINDNIARTFTLLRSQWAHGTERHVLVYEVSRGIVE